MASIDYVGISGPAGKKSTEHEVRYACKFWEYGDVLEDFYAKTVAAKKQSQAMGYYFVVGFKPPVSSKGSDNISPTDHLATFLKHCLESSDQESGKAFTPVSFNQLPDGLISMSLQDGSRLCTALKTACDLMLSKKAVIFTLVGDDDCDCVVNVSIPTTVGEEKGAMDLYQRALAVATERNNIKTGSTVSIHSLHQTDVLKKVKSDRKIDSSAGKFENDDSDGERSSDDEEPDQKEGSPKKKKKDPTESSESGGSSSSSESESDSEQTEKSAKSSKNIKHKK